MTGFKGGKEPGANDVRVCVAEREGERDEQDTVDFQGSERTGITHLVVVMNRESGSGYSDPLLVAAQIPLTDCLIEESIAFTNLYVPFWAEQVCVSVCQAPPALRLAATNGSASLSLCS